MKLFLGISLLTLWVASLPGQTVVNLTATPNPATFGSPVTLTATVASNATGRITFYDGVTVLGSKPVTSGSAALSTILLPAGARKLRAWYSGDASHPAATSNLFAETVRTVPGGGFVPQTPVPVFLLSNVVVADFNRDGRPNLALIRATNPSDLVSVFLGKPDATFQPPIDIPISPTIGPIATADFDGDGNMDIAFNTTTSSYILRGHGDGTFDAPAAFGTGGSSLTVADFNNDGIPNVVTTQVQVRFIPDPQNTLQPHEGGPIYSTDVVLFPGNGDGTFGPSRKLQTLDYTFGPSVALADFNGDFTPDLAVWNSLLDIMLGAPGGPSQLFSDLIPDLAYTQLASPPVLLAADFNGDGKIDLALSAVASQFIAGAVVHTPITWILLGAGDGSFQPPVAYPLGASTHLGDFNGDGAIDLVVADANGAMSGVLLGRGDGSFQQFLQVAAGRPLAVADFNQDGRPDILTANDSASAVTVLLGAVPSVTPPGAPATLVATGGSNQSAALGGTFSAPLQVTVRDAFGAPVSGVIVTFSAPSGNASATLSTNRTFTDGSGNASVTATANNAAGTYLVTAAAGSLTATFTLTNQQSGSPNLALNKAAIQSSTLAGYPGAAASSAVDGNPNPNFFHNSVTATNFENSPWWQVDLTGSVAIGSVTVFNRTDCCSDRLNDFWVFISDTPFQANETPATLQNRANTFASRLTGPAGASVTVATPGVAGRYLRIQLSGSNYLSLAEVQVTGPSTTAVNLALGQPTAQSSYFDFHTAGSAVAVDGSTDGNYYNGSVTTTNQEASPWWQVDLGASANISSVVIWNRSDCCASRLSDYWIFVSDSPFLNSDSPVTLQSRAGTFSLHQTTAPNPSVTLPIAAAGRYVRIQLNGTGLFSLAEVQVMGTGPAPPSNLASGKAATQSSTFPGYPAAAAASAVDGNRDGNFFHNSVTATNQDANPWWQVDLGGSANISTVLLWNRTDCCADRLTGFSVYVSDTPFGPDDNDSTLSNRPGTTSLYLGTTVGRSQSVQVLARGRYVRVQLNAPGILSLAEVQVFGTLAAPLPNLALNRPATQSSTLPGYSPDAASAAVDGNTDGAFFNGSVTATTSEPNAWWQVDLGSSSAVGSVVVWNRTDPCCTARLADYWVFVSDTPFQPGDTPATLQTRLFTFSSHLVGPPLPSTQIHVGGQGRYVRIQLSGTGYLSLAEVQVYSQ